VVSVYGVGREDHRATWRVRSCYLRTGAGNLPEKFEGAMPWRTQGNFARRMKAAYDH
jgi:hypothetical protein